MNKGKKDRASHTVTVFVGGWRDLCINTVYGKQGL